MRKLNSTVLAAAVALTLVLPPAAVIAQSLEAEGAAALGLALRRLGTTKRVLMIAAHPDDENTAVLSTLALNEGADVAYLSLTRGEGGQNLIGPELQEGLGLIRSEELLAARRLDGAQQFFTRAYDYGYSKSAAEAFSHWPADSLLADVVAVIRRFRPDIVITVFSGTPRDGHGQHEVAGILARRAFDAAGDGARFAARGAPHQPRYLYQAMYRPTGEENIRLATGALDPLFGRSHFQIAMASRSRHRSQDMGQAQPPGPRSTVFTLIDGDRPADAVSLFVGIDTTIAQAAARTAGTTAALLLAYQDTVHALRAAYNPLQPDALVSQLTAADALLARALTVVRADGELHAAIEHERAQLHHALSAAAGIMLDATADRPRIVPGETVALTLTVWNGGARPVEVRALEPVLPAGWTVQSASPAARILAAGDVLTRELIVRVPPNAQPSEPYFLRAPRDGDLYTWPADSAVRGLPFESPPVRARIDLEIAGVELQQTTEAAHVVIDKAFGERRSPLLVVPAVSVQVQPHVLVLPVDAPPDERSRTLRLMVRSAAADTVRGVVHVEPPAGWRAQPERSRLTLAAHDVQQIDVTLESVGQPAPGAGTVQVRFVRDEGTAYARGYDVIDYPHIQPRALYRPAAATVVTVDVAIAPDLAIGYIEGAGDDGAEALRQLGARVTPLDSTALASGDLGAYDAIVAGIRAYEVRTDLIRHNDRVLEYARNGGTFVVQYNKYELVDGSFTAYPMTMARPHGRVTDEGAPVQLLLPEHRALSWPNRIDARDFEGWAHERGLYFADTWDDAYAAPLAMSDAGEAPLAGSLLVAPYGSGYYVYTGLAFFRQFPEGVAGAYRLLANLVSLGAGMVP